MKIYVCEICVGPRNFFFQYLKQTRSHFFPRKGANIFCTRWHCAHGCENTPEYCEWIKAHKHQL